MKTTIKAVLLLLFICSTLKTTAQSGSWQIGVNGGVFIYQGDLAPSSLGSYKTPSFTFGLNVSKILNPSFALRANLALGKLRGDDAAYDDPAWRKERNLNFSTPVVEFSGLLVWDLFGNHGNELGMRFSPYLLGGAGLNKLSVSRDYSKLNRNVFPYGSKEQIGFAVDSSRATPRLIVVLPLGAGVAWNISSNWFLTFETLFRYTFTDYLDGFSYIANPGRKDFYHSHTIGLNYRFGGGSGNKKTELGCPVMKF